MKLKIKNKQQESILHIDKNEIVIGKSKDCDLQLKGWFIADKHCAIKKLSGGYVVEDLNRGANGTLVNKKKIDFFGPLDLTNDTIFINNYSINILEEDSDDEIKIVNSHSIDHSILESLINVSNEDTVHSMICAELAGDFHLGYARQLTDKSSLLFDLAF